MMMMLIAITTTPTTTTTTAAAAATTTIIIIIIKAKPRARTPGGTWCVNTFIHNNDSWQVRYRQYKLGLNQFSTDVIVIMNTLHFGSA